MHAGNHKMKLKQPGQEVNISFQTFGAEAEVHFKRSQNLYSTHDKKKHIHFQMQYITYTHTNAYVRGIRNKLRKNVSLSQ